MADDILQRIDQAILTAVFGVLNTNSAPGNGSDAVDYASAAQILWELKRS